MLLTGILGGLVSSTATTLLYARRSRESPGMERLAGAVVAVANLVPLVRIALIAAILAPVLVPVLATILGSALIAGIAFTVLLLRNIEHVSATPAPQSRNPAELGTAIKFGALYALVLLASAWLSDLAGSGGLYAAAIASGLADVDPIVLSALNLFGSARLDMLAAVTAIALAYGANLVFKFGVLRWFDRRLARQMLGPFLAMLGGGAAGWRYLAIS